MNKIPFTLTGESLTVFHNGTHYFNVGTTQYREIAKAIAAAAWDRIPALLDPNAALQSFLGDGFTATDGGISYHNVPLPESIVTRLHAMAGAGQDPSPLLRFYERLHKNPSFRSREQLHRFMQHLDIAIEPDGTFLAYKGVNSDYTDRHTGKVNNLPGARHVMDRNLVSDDPATACHYGFHVGALEYARGFGSTVVICRVDPENVVCVPNDYSSQKMRVCEYEVVGEWSGQTLSQVSDPEDLPGEDYDIELDDLDDPEDEVLEPVEEVCEPVFTKVAAPKLDRLDAKKLMQRSIEDLRRYASGRLKIHGASKIPGGKSALVSKILKIRRKRAK